MLSRFVESVLSRFVESVLLFNIDLDLHVFVQQASSMDVLIIPGGFAPDYWRRDQRILQLVRDMDASSKILASVCHGPWVLISAKVIKGRNVTCFSAIKDDVENAGANYTDTSVVVDKNMVTSRLPKDLPDFCKAIIGLLK